MRIRAGTKRKRRSVGGTRKHIRSKKGKMVKEVKTKEFIKLNCSPENNNKNKNNTKQFTCFSDDELHKLRSMWNARHPDLKINSNNRNK